MQSVQQNNIKCECGSWYHVNGICNKCKDIVYADKSQYNNGNAHYIPKQKGAGRDKAKHKVICR
jgi:hypothetical protein